MYDYASISIYSTPCLYCTVWKLARRSGAVDGGASHDPRRPLPPTASNCLQYSTAVRAGRTPCRTHSSQHGIDLIYVNHDRRYSCSGQREQDSGRFTKHLIGDYKLSTVDCRHLHNPCGPHATCLEIFGSGQRTRYSCVMSRLRPSLAALATRTCHGRAARARQSNHGARGSRAACHLAAMRPSAATRVARPA